MTEWRYSCIGRVNIQLWSIEYTCDCKMFRWPCIVINYYNKINQIHKFLKFIFGIKLYMFRTVPLSIIRSFFTAYTATVYVIQVCWQLASCQQTCMTYTIALCTVKNSWWWTEELSETCRVLFRKWIWEICASSWFYYKNLTQCVAVKNDLIIFLS